MKIAEKIIAGLVILALILKLLHIPGGSTFSVLFIGILSMFYFAGGFFLFKTDDTAVDDGFLYKKTNSARVFGSIATGLSLSAALVGILFKVMYWPGAAVQLIFGLFCLLVIGIICLIKYLKDNPGYYRTIGIRVAIVGITGIILFFT
jgi:hypothetical protein